MKTVDIAPGSIEARVLDRAINHVVKIGKEIGRGLSVKQIKNDGRTLVLSDGVEYHLGKVNSYEVLYWPKEMRHDWDLIGVYVDVDQDGTRGDMSQDGEEYAWHGS